MHVLGIFEVPVLDGVFSTLLVLHPNKYHLYSQFFVLTMNLKSYFRFDEYKIHSSLIMGPDG